MSTGTKCESLVNSNRPMGNVVGRMVLGFERACVRFSVFARWYEAMFYRRLVHREVDIAKLPAGARILHIGAGPYPFTALILGEMGYRVVAIDNDADAVRAARRTVRARGLDNRVTIRHGDGRDVDCSGYAGVWISFHARPKDAIISKVARGLDADAVVVARIPNNPGPLSSLGTQTQAVSAQRFDPFKSILALRCANAKTEDDVPAIETLDGFSADQLVRVLRGNGHPHLEPLGLRAGKVIRVCARMPLGGALLLDVDGRKVALGAEVARGIQCERSIAVD